jgi:hypothetical protein
MLPETPRGAITGLACAMALWLATATSVSAEPALARMQQVAGPPAAEDLLELPGTRWVLVSAISVGPEAAPGIYIVDNDPPHLQKLVIEQAGSPDGNGRCPARLEVEGFSPLGMAWRESGDGARELMVINRGSRKAVEFFSVATATAVPVLRWRDCLPLPPDVTANSLASLADGGIVLTQNSDARDKDSWARQQRGEVTGQLWRWHRESGWTPVPGTSLSGPNGVVASADGCYVLVAAWAERRLVQVPLACSAPNEVTSASASLPYLPDNLRWTDRGTVLATGQLTTPDGLLACVRRSGPCPGQVIVSEIDPEDMSVVHEWHLDAGESLGLGTTALQVRDEVWVSSILGRVIGRFTPAQPD